MRPPACCRPSCTGDPGCAVAVTDASSDWSLSAPTVTAHSAGGGWTVTGTTVGLSTPSEPDTVLLAAAIPGGARVVLRCATKHFSVTPADLLDPRAGWPDSISRLPPRVVRRPRTGLTPRSESRITAVSWQLAAEQLGVARMCLDTSVDYAKNRTQFGSRSGRSRPSSTAVAEVLPTSNSPARSWRRPWEYGSPADAESAFIVATRAALAASDGLHPDSRGHRLSRGNTRRTGTPPRTRQRHPDGTAGPFTAMPSPDPRPVR